MEGYRRSTPHRRGEPLTNDTNGPIFVAGPERSGTSLMWALLRSHPNIAMTRRTNFWKYFYGQFGDLADDISLDRCLAVMMRYDRLVDLNTDWERLRADFMRGEPTYGRLFALLEGQYAERAGKSRWGDKSLDTEQFAGPILEAYPQARILHLIRDPRDRYASVHARWGFRYGGVGAGSGIWRLSARLGMRNEERYPDHYRLVRYESLVNDPEGVLRDICSFIGEPFDPMMLSMGQAQSFHGSNSSYGPRTPRAISTDSIGRFRTVLSPRQTAFIQIANKREMRRFGYEADEPLTTWPARLAFMAGTLPLELSKMIGWRAREAYRARTGRTIAERRLLPEEALV